MKFTNYFSPLFCDDGQTQDFRHPNPVMVAPASDRTAPVPVATPYQPRPRAYRAKKNPPMNIADFPEPRIYAPFNDARINAHADRFPKHPGLYVSRAKPAFPPVDTHRGKQKFKPSKSKPFKTPPVAAFKTSFPSNHPSGNPSNKPVPRKFNSKNNPAIRNKFFKRDVWNKLNSNDRNVYHHRLAQSKLTVNRALQHRLKTHPKIYQPTSFKNHHARNNYNSTDHASMKSTHRFSNEYDYRHPFTSKTFSWPQLDPKRWEGPYFHTKAYTIRTNMIHDIKQIADLVQHKQHYLPFEPRYQLENNLHSMDIILISRGYRNVQHHRLVHRFFHNKSIAFLPLQILRNCPSIRRLLQNFFHQDIYGRDTFVHHCHRSLPTHTYRETPRRPHPQQRAFMVTTQPSSETTTPSEPTTSRRFTRSLLTKSTTIAEPTSTNTAADDPDDDIDHLVPNDAPTNEPEEIQSNNNNVLQNIQEDDDEDINSSNHTNEQATDNDNDNHFLSDVEDDTDHNDDELIDIQQQHEHDATNDEEPIQHIALPINKRPNYKQQYRPPSRMKKSPTSNAESELTAALPTIRPQQQKSSHEDNDDDMPNWDDIDNDPLESTNTSIFPFGFIPIVGDHKLSDIETYLNDLRYHSSNPTASHYDSPEFHFEVLQLLLRILRKNILDHPRIPDNHDCLHTVWYITRIIAEVGNFSTMMIIHKPRYKYERVFFIEDCERLIKILYKKTIETGFDVTTIKELAPLFNNDDNPTSDVNQLFDFDDRTTWKYANPYVPPSSTTREQPSQTKTSPNSPLTTITKTPSKSKISIRTVSGAGDDDPSSSSSSSDDNNDRKAKKSKPDDREPKNVRRTSRADDDEHESHDHFSSASSSSSNSHRSMNISRHSSDDSTHKNKKTSRKNKDKKEEDRTKVDAFTNRLLKVAKNLGMKPLEIVSDPIMRRARFNTWATHLRIVLTSFPETKRMLKDSTTIEKLDDDIDQCVYQLILAKSGTAAMNALESVDHTSGYDAYIDLRRQCAQVNEHLQQTAHQALLALQWSDTETATAFLTKFRAALAKCQHLGLRFNENQKVNQFFAITQKLTRSSIYYVRVETLRANRFLYAEPMTIADIETNLYGLDEDITNQKSHTRRPYKEEAALYTNSGRHPKRNGKGKFSKPPNDPNVICHYCQKPGHKAPECRQRMRDNGITPPQSRPQPNGRPNHKPNQNSYRNDKRPNRKPYNNTNGNSKQPRCYNCNEFGHYSSNCPKPKKSSNTGPTNRAMFADHEPQQYSVDTKTDNSRDHSPPIRQAANRATTIHHTENRQQMIFMAHIVLPRKPFYHQKWWKLHPKPDQHPPQDDFRNYIPDSGATSHFTPVESDLTDATDCHVPVLLADGNTVYATKIGYSKINFTTDQGRHSTLHLANVHYVPNLNHRLFSLQAFTRQTDHHAEIKDTTTKLVFDDGATYTWPFIPQPDDYDSYIETANATTQPPPVPTPPIPVQPNTDPTTEPQNPTDIPPPPALNSAQRPTRTIPLEKASIRFGFRSSRGLLAGTYYNMWDDYQIRPGFDSFSPSLRIGVNRVHNISKEPFDIPQTPFALLFMDVIPTPRMRALTVSIAYPGSLLIVDAFTRYSMWIGLPKIDSENVIQAFKHFLVRTRSTGRSTQVNFLRADAGSYFASDSFTSWCRNNNFHISLAAPHHQEMNSICERQWQTINQIARVCLVHARLPLEYFHFAVLYAIAILNVLPAKGVNDATGTPSCPYALAFGKRPKIGNFRVFGCPAAIKRYSTATSSGDISSDLSDDFQQTPKPLQRAVRGIFIGFPEHQAGWLFYLPNPLGRHNYIISRDAVFDESFESTLAHVHAPYSGAMPERCAHPLVDHLHVHETNVPFQSTGNVADYPYRLPVTGEEGGEINPEENFEHDPIFDQPDPILQDDDTNIDDDD